MSADKVSWWLAVGGLLVGAFISRQCVPHYVMTEVQSDTTVVHDTVTIIAEKMVTEIVEVKGDIEYIYIHIRDTIVETDTIYRTIPVERMYYRTRTQEAEIWHSGVESRIDSMTVYRDKEIVTLTQYVERQSPDWHFSAYVGADYMQGKDMSITPKIGAEIGYKRVSADVQVGIDIGKDIQPYIGIGVRYDIIHR